MGGHYNHGENHGNSGKELVQSVGVGSLQEVEEEVYHL
jgi:hypothetical protein